ncbi:myb-like protein D [Melanaphis sacchari]|uniref:myb-like protein D n=1 Tax=Melanaphis sacchari TaxID=742174 RepID=UPI000DC143AC|nr:myb-like protein D [Melanaphis sacchari]
MDPAQAQMMNEIRSLRQLLEATNQKIDNIAISERIRDETVRKSANSITVIIRLLAGLSKLSVAELRDILIESDALLNTIHPIPTTDQNIDPTPVTNNQLKTVLKEVSNLLTLMSNVEQPSNQSSSTTSDSENAYINKINEEERLRFWRKYKNKYNYMGNIRCKVSTLETPVRELEHCENAIVNITQNNINEVVQNDLNANTHNNLNDIVQNDVNDETQNNVNEETQNNVNEETQNDVNEETQNNVNEETQNDNDVNEETQNNVNEETQNDVNEETQNDVNFKFTRDDVIKNKAVYEMLRSRLKNSPYDDPIFFHNNVRLTHINIKTVNGESVIKPVSCVAPLIILNKCDEKSSSPSVQEKPLELHQSTSNGSSSKRETRANTTKIKTNSSNANVETSTKKRSLTIKNSKCKSSKKKKKLKQPYIH